MSVYNHHDQMSEREKKEREREGERETDRASVSRLESVPSLSNPTISLVQSCNQR